MQAFFAISFCISYLCGPFFNKNPCSYHDMFTIISIMLSGMLTGYLLRRFLFGRLGRVIAALIWTLLFLLGLEVGSNERIVSGLATLGLEALLITLAGTLGSVLAAWGLWRYTQQHSASAPSSISLREK